MIKKLIDLVNNHVVYKESDFEIEELLVRDLLNEGRRELTRLGSPPILIDDNTFLEFYVMLSAKKCLARYCMVNRLYPEINHLDSLMDANEELKLLLNNPRKRKRIKTKNQQKEEAIPAIHEYSGGNPYGYYPQKEI